MKKILAMLLALTVVGGIFTACGAEEATQSGLSSQASVDSSNPDNYKYSDIAGLTPQNIDYQGEYTDIASYYYIDYGLTNDGMLVAFDVDDGCIAIPNATSFANVHGTLVAVCCSDGTYELFQPEYDENCKKTVLSQTTVPTLIDGCYCTIDGNDLRYIANQKGTVSAFAYQGDELVANDVPFRLKMGFDEIYEECTAFFVDDCGFISFYLDAQNRLFRDFAIDINFDEENDNAWIVTIREPVFTDCANVFATGGPNITFLATKQDDSSNLYIVDNDSNVEQIALPEALAAESIEKIVCCDLEDYLLVTENDEILLMKKSADMYDIVIDEELTRLMQQGSIIKIVESSQTALFLMDDDCIYKFSVI